MLCVGRGCGGRWRFHAAQMAYDQGVEAAIFIASHPLWSMGRAGTPCAPVPAPATGMASLRP